MPPNNDTDSSNLDRTLPTYYNRTAELSLSFCGCGFLGAYHIGVIACIREKFPALIESVSRIYGSSVGTLIGALILCGVESRNAINFMNDVTLDLINHYYGIFNLKYDLCEVIRNYLIKELPSNISEIASNKLYINVTCFPSMNPMIISLFESKDDFIDAIVCSCYIPFVTSKRVQRFRGKICLDGGLTNNQPTPPNKYSSYEMYKMIIVSPFIGEGDISPKFFHDFCDNAISISNQKFILTYNNLKRLINGFNPKNVTDILKFAYDGYNDTEAYLKRRQNHIQKCKMSKESNYDSHIIKFPPIAEINNNFKQHLKTLEELIPKYHSHRLIRKVTHLLFAPFKIVVYTYTNVVAFTLSIGIITGNLVYSPFSKLYSIFGLRNYFKIKI